MMILENSYDEEMKGHVTRVMDKKIDEELYRYMRKCPTHNYFSLLKHVFSFMEVQECTKLIKERIEADLSRKELSNIGMLLECLVDICTRYKVYSYIKYTETTLEMHGKYCNEYKTVFEKLQKLKEEAEKNGATPISLMKSKLTKALLDHFYKYRYSYPLLFCVLIVFFFKKKPHLLKRLVKLLI